MFLNAVEESRRRQLVADVTAEVVETLRNEGILIYDGQGESFRFDPVRAMFFQERKTPVD